MFTCPCCGYEVFDEPPGSYSICPICFWEDDVFQLFYPSQQGGPNRVSLIEAQINFVQFGSCERGMSKNVRPPNAAEHKNQLWFPLWQKRVELPDHEADTSNPLNETELAKLCYWLRT